MSDKYPGGIITKSPATPTGPYESGTAPGIWTLEQQMQYQQQGIWPTAGLTPPYIEDVFSTYLYDGNSSTQTITNNIDLSTQGGLVWIKARNGSGATRNHRLWTTNIGGNKVLQSDSTAALYDYGSPQVTFNSNGFGLSSDAGINATSSTYVSWTFRKQPKFFDVVTWTGDNTAGRQISHSLGSTPGFIVFKCTNTTGDWYTIARITDTSYSFGLKLNTTDAQLVATNPSSTISTTWFVPEYFNGSIPDSNASGNTYVAYLFAHNAGGFGLTGTDNVISCGSYTATGNDPVELGYEPQWLLTKRINTTGNWAIDDTMRGFSLTGDRFLNPNLSDAESAGGGDYPTATGFVGKNYGSGTIIYIAIRRGPMKVPTSGTSVYNAIARTGTNANATISGVGFSPDLILGFTSSPAANYSGFVDRLRGINPTAFLSGNNQATNSEYILNTATNLGVTSLTMDGVTLDADQTFAYINYSTRSYSTHFFKRAPSFFDEVCYTGNSVTPRTITHNLGVAPELMIIKSRSNARGWAVYANAIGNNKYLILNSTSAALTDTTIWVNTAPTSSVFTVGDPFDVNNSGYTYVAYLFATCAGVSKVGSYTGNGTTQTIDCGFTGGARFVIIKRTDAAGGWYIYDTARGMTVLTDPYLFLNDTAAEVATLGSVTTVSTGFALNSTILAAINVSAASYIFLAIA
jgi:hypothetical protein